MKGYFSMPSAYGVLIRHGHEYDRSNFAGDILEKGAFTVDPADYAPGPECAALVSLSGNRLVRSHAPIAMKVASRRANRSGCPKHGIISRSTASTLATRFSREKKGSSAAGDDAVRLCLSLTGDDVMSFMYHMLGVIVYGEIRYS